MSGFARKLLVVVAVAAIAMAHTLAPHRVMALHGAGPSGVVLGAEKTNFGADAAAASDHHASGTPCHGHDDAAPKDRGKAPHDCCVAACHLIAMIDGGVEIVLTALPADRPLSVHPAMRDTPLGGIDPPPRIG